MCEPKTVHFVDGKPKQLSERQKKLRGSAELGNSLWVHQNKQSTGSKIVSEIRVLEVFNGLNVFYRTINESN